MKPFITIKELREKLSKKEITYKDISHHFRSRIHKYNPILNAFLEVYEDEFDEETQPQNGLLSGISGILKNNICQVGKKTTCGSKILSNFYAPYDATVVKRLKDAGAVIMGSGNMDEFAMGASGEFSAFGPAKNPWNLNHSPGGSSSGPAAAVAAGLVPWGLASETGGSVRQPASFCSLVGLYPTYGTFSRYGLIAFASSTDSVGPITRTVYDNALIASVLSGHDPKDSTSLSSPKKDFTKFLNGKMPNQITIGYLQESLESEGVHPEIKITFEAALKELANLGAVIKPITLPNLKYGISVYFVISRAEAASNLYRYDGSLYGLRAQADDLFSMYLHTRQEGFGAEVKKRILMGNYVLSASHKEAFYKKALNVREILRKEFDDAFKEVDLLVSPTASTLPFELGKECKDPLALYLADYFTVPNCITGNPSLSLQCGFSKNGLPIGMQFIGPRQSEKLLYQVGYAYEQSTSHHLKTPKDFE